MANYVKFLRGSIDEYKSLAQKDIDTLYFILDDSSETASLYLGSRLISSLQDLNDLNDVLITEVKNKDILQYNSETGNWENLSFENFLNAIDITIPIDEAVLEYKDNNKLSLKNYGVRFYRYVEATEIENAHYELVEVNDTNPWVAGLEPKTISENGQLVIGWFEPNPTTVEGIKDQVNILQTDISKLEQQIIILQADVGTMSSDTTDATGLHAVVEHLEIAKANVADVYTKSETNVIIEKAVAAADHLKRIIVNSIDDIDVDAPDADIYIYMVSTGTYFGDDKYDEYLVVSDTDSDGNAYNRLERIGSWEVDLSNYATVSMVAEVSTLLSDYQKSNDNRVQIVEAKINTLETKLANVEDGAEKNIIASVTSDFLIDANRQLHLNNISMAKVANLEATLAKKIDAVEGYGLISTADIEKLTTIEKNAQVNIIDSVNETYFSIGEVKVLNLSDTFVNRFETIENAITWVEL